MHVAAPWPWPATTTRNHHLDSPCHRLTMAVRSVTPRVRGSLGLQGRSDMLSAPRRAVGPALLDFSGPPSGFISWNKLVGYPDFFLKNVGDKRLFQKNGKCQIHDYSQQTKKSGSLVVVVCRKPTCIESPPASRMFCFPYCISMIISRVFSSFV